MNAYASDPVYLAHAQARARERFGIDPTSEDWRDVLLQITARPCQAVLIADLSFQAPPREIWLVRLCGTEVSVVWSPDQARVITVLDPTESQARSVSEFVRRSYRAARRQTGSTAPKRERDRLREEMRQW